MKINLIAAVAENKVIGSNNDLPWRIRDDMRFFKETTNGHPVIMGRRNFESIGRPLPYRYNIVVTRSKDFNPKGVKIVHSVEDAFNEAEKVVITSSNDEVFVIGGAEIYSLALPYAHKFYRTRVLANIDGDVFFPEFDENEWKSKVLFEYPKDERNEYPFVIEFLERKVSPLPVE